MCNSELKKMIVMDSIHKRVGVRQLKIYSAVFPMRIFTCGIICVAVSLPCFIYTAVASLTMNSYGCPTEYVMTGELRNFHL